MNQSGIRTRILESLNESSSSPSFWSTTQVDEYINEGMQVLAEEAHAIKRTALISLQPGTTYYDTKVVGDDVMAPYRLWVYPDDRRLDAVGFDQLNRFHHQWPTVTNEQPNVWFSISWHVFGIWPHPTAGEKTLRVDYYAWPRDLLDDSDEPELPLPDHNNLVLYGIYQGLLKRWNLTEALKAFAEFAKEFTDASARAGVRRIQRQLFQRSTQPGLRVDGDVGSSVRI